MKSQSTIEEIYNLENITESEEVKIAEYLKTASELLEDSCEGAYFDTVEAALELQKSRDRFEEMESYNGNFASAYASFYQELEREITERFPDLQ